MNWKEKLYQHYVSSEQAGKKVFSSGELFAGNRPYVEQLIRDHFPADRQIHILDIGCGHGTFLYFAKEKGYMNVRGIDFSEEQVALAHRLGLQEVQRASLEEFLQTSKDKYDLVLMIDVLEHLEPQELFDALDSVAAILRPDARLIIHVPNAEGLFGMRIRYGDYTHTQAFTPRSIRQILLTCGFDDIRCMEERPVAKGIKGMIRNLLWRLGTLNSRLLLMAETGEREFVLSQNMLVVASRKQESPR
ncbi:MAG TPA: class I SAM-dependent methyltransferase [Puia sp.]|jgi:SAM-dependent methyltransferase